MADKVLLVTVLLAALVLCGTLPFARLRVAWGGLRSWGIWLAIIGAGGAALIVGRGMPGLASPLILALPFALLAGGRGAVAGGLVALPLLAGAVWWAPEMQLSAGRAVLFVLLGFGAISIARISGTDNRGWWLFPVGFLALLSASWTGAFADGFGFYGLWHHWSVYTAAAEGLRAGLVPYNDLPVQYGMGPLLLIGALCADSCWTGTWRVVALTQVFYVIAMCGCVLLLTKVAPRGMALLALLAMLLALLGWTGFPPNWHGPLVTPSVGGMRFLPLALLLSHILWAEHSGRRRDLLGHALWFVALGWSPEAAVQASVVWWAHLGLRRAQALDAAVGLLRGAVIGAVAVASGAVALAVIFRLGFGEWPSIPGYLVYLRNPPGALAANPLGPAWLAVAALLACLVGIGSASGATLRQGMAVSLAMVLTGTYYLGRSHDNNVLNLFPFLVLVLAWLATNTVPARGFASVAMAGLVAWSATFASRVLTDARGVGEATMLGPTRLLERMRVDSAIAYARLDSVLQPQPPAADAGAALSWLRTQGAAQPLYVSVAMALPNGMTGPAWTGLNNLGTFALLPPAVLSAYAAAGATKLRRDGWVVGDPTQAAHWLAVFATSYAITEEKRFGGTVVWRLKPH